MADADILVTRSYKDVSLTFARNPVTNDVVAVTDADAVKRSVKNILNTIAGEVPFFPYFGTRLYRLLFEPIDAITTTLMAEEIRSTLTQYEPRIRIQELNIVPTEDENRYEVTLVFAILNQPQPVTLTIFLSRIR